MDLMDVLVKTQDTYCRVVFGVEDNVISEGYYGTLVKEAEDYLFDEVKKIFLDYSGTPAITIRI